MHKDPVETDPAGTDPTATSTASSLGRGAAPHAAEPAARRGVAHHADRGGRTPTRPLATSLGALLLLAACGGGGGDGGAAGDVGGSDAGGVEGGDGRGGGDGADGATDATGGSDGDGPTVDRTPPLPSARGLLPSLAVADDNFESDHHSGSGNCAACHNADEMVVTTESGEELDVSINTAWATSTMANATRDPYWHAVFAYELDLFPNLEDEINDTCTVCHAPMANDFAKKTGQPLRLFDSVSETSGEVEPGIYSMDSGDELFNHAMDGVSCTLCHQIDPGNLGIGSTMPESSMTGGFEIVDYSDGDISDRPAYGPYPDPDAAYMRQQVGFLAQEGAHMQASETCAVCHNLNVESVDTGGVPVEGLAHFAEQATYTEWLFSDYAVGKPLEANCQSCHMPEVDQPVIIASGNGSVERDNVSRHTFLAANTVMQAMLRDFAAELGVQPGLDFDASIVRNREFLATSATVTIEDASVDAEATGNTLNFDVDILNESGHKFPSGYHSRRAWLHVLVTDQDGRVVFENGRMNADGSIVGVSEDTNPSIWEEHHDVITSANQVQVYQAIVGNSDGKHTHSLLNGSFYLKDNRITPQGFLKRVVTGSPDVLPSFGVFGRAMDDDDFDSGRDTVSYRVPVPPADEYNVRVMLKYQPLSFGHLRALFLESERIDQVDMFRTIYDASPLKAEVIGTVTAVVN